MVHCRTLDCGYRKRNRQHHAVLILTTPAALITSRSGHPERPQRITNSVPLFRLVMPSGNGENQILLQKKCCSARIRPNISRESRPPGKISMRIHRPTKMSTDTPRAPPARQSRLLGKRSVAARAFQFNAAARASRHARSRDGILLFTIVAANSTRSRYRRAERVAIWDFDAHHGNGTKEIVANNPHIAFASIHQFPAYPGTGEHSFANIHNFPIAPLTPRANHVREVERALQTLSCSSPISCSSPQDLMRMPVIRLLR